MDWIAKPLDKMNLFTYLHRRLQLTPVSGSINPLYLAPLLCNRTSLGFKRKHLTWRVFRGKAERQNRRCTQCTQLLKPVKSKNKGARKRLLLTSTSLRSTLIRRKATVSLTQKSLLTRLTHKRLGYDQGNFSSRRAWRYCQF